MFTCETCSKKFARVSIVETGTETTYKAEFKGKGKRRTLVLTQPDVTCGDEHKLSWDCPRCNAWNVIASGVSYETHGLAAQAPTH